MNRNLLHTFLCVYSFNFTHWLKTAQKAGCWFGLFVCLFVFGAAIGCRMLITCLWREPVHVRRSLSTFVLHAFFRVTIFTFDRQQKKTNYITQQNQITGFTFLAPFCHMFQVFGEYYISIKFYIFYDIDLMSKNKELRIQHSMMMKSFEPAVKWSCFITQKFHIL